MSAKYCENCGCKVFSLGCVNCDEQNYIDEQIGENIEYERQKEKEKIEPINSGKEGKV